MSSEELKRALKKAGCTFGTQNGSHLKVYFGARQTVIPMHGKTEVKPGTLRAIFRQLGLEKLK